MDAPFKLQAGAHSSLGHRRRYAAAGDAEDQNTSVIDDRSDTRLTAKYYEETDHSRRSILWRSISVGFCAALQERCD
jgi:hypothetical protein